MDNIALIVGLLRQEINLNSIERTEIMPNVLSKRNGQVNGIYVGRPTKFGNPFTIGKDGNREQVIAKYRSYLNDHPELIEQAKRELRGKNLVCWCAPLACHADILLEVANA